MTVSGKTPTARLAALQARIAALEAGLRKAADELRALGVSDSKQLEWSDYVWRVTGAVRSYLEGLLAEGETLAGPAAAPDGFRVALHAILNTAQTLPHWDENNLDVWVRQLQAALRRTRDRTTHCSVHSGRARDPGRDAVTDHVVVSDALALGMLKQLVCARGHVIPVALNAPPEVIAYVQPCPKTINNCAPRAARADWLRSRPTIPTTGGGA